MTTDYEALYRKTKYALGAPTQAFIDFFNAYPKKPATILDVGCGQGRDALFIARLGHHVTGVDSSPSGVAHLLADAQREDLKVDGYVADIRHFQSRRKFDVVIVDRTLHMLSAIDRHKVLEKLLARVRNDGHILIADEPKNVPAFEDVIDRSPRNWRPTVKRGGLFFLAQGRAR